MSRALAALLSVWTAGCAGLAEEPWGSPPSPVGAVSFRPTLQEDLERMACTACHDGSAPMTVKAGPTTDLEWVTNFREVRARAGDPRANPLVDMALGAGGHPKVLTRDSPVVARWRAWMNAGMPYAAPAAPASDSGADGGADGTLSWKRSIGRLLATRCTGCHGEASPRGRYALHGYAQAVAGGSDASPNVVPGDGESTLAVYCKNGHYIGGAEAERVIRWIVDWNATEE